MPNNFEPVEGEEIKIGDTIRIGTGTIDWDVVAIEPHWATKKPQLKLRSGMTGRHIWALVGSTNFRMVKRGGALAY